MASLFAPLASPIFSPASRTRIPSSWAILIKNANTRKLLCTVNTNDGARRSANYAPTCWDNNFLWSLGMHKSHMDESNTNQINKVKDVVRRLINDDVTTPLAKLELIDTVQRLGLKNQFDKEIKRALDSIFQKSDDAWFSDDLHATSLRFRLLRQNGYTVHPDVFESFKDETGMFRASLCRDVNGLLSMYEASFLGWDEELIIDEAKMFTIAMLKDVVAGGDYISSSLTRKVRHALDMPLHWRLTRIEARWFIETYEQEQNMNPSLLEMAKLDFNMTQSIYQQELCELARWWADTELGQIEFVRDRLVEHYFWCLGMISEPRFGDFRDMKTKIVSMITAIDDNYDIFCYLNELELLTDYIDRWDINGIDKLPFDTRKCFLILINTSNDIGHWMLKERGFNIIPYLRKAWGDLCTAYLKEAKWYHGGQKPTLQEYLDNGMVSIAAPLMLLCAYLLTTDNIDQDTLRYINKFPRIMRCTAMIVRLTNDLVTSSDELARGDNLKALQCYMNETGASEEEARGYINDLIADAWKTLNKDVFDANIEYPLSEPFLSAIPNLARAAQFFYQYGDGHGAPKVWTKDHLMSLLVEPIP